MKTLIVPYDFSDCSDAAADQASVVANGLGATMVLLYVHHPENVRPEFQSGAVTYQEMETERKELEKVAARLKDRFSSLSVRVSVTQEVEGGTVATLLEESEREGADLIVMGTHGRTGLGHLVLGSVAEKIVREAKMPVMVTKAAHRL